MRRDATATGTPTACSLRPGHPHELALAVAIDDDACTAFVEHDRRFDLTLADDHPYVRAERTRWAAAASLGQLLFACAPDGVPVGLVIFDLLDGAPHLEQVSVRRAWSRHGLGRMLVEHALSWSANRGDLWLTTYDHVPWNRPWYARLGFVAVPEDACGAGLRGALAAERHALPDPERRVAMVHRHAAVSPND